MEIRIILNVIICGPYLSITDYVKSLKEQFKRRFEQCQRISESFSKFELILLILTRVSERLSYFFTSQSYLLTFSSKAYGISKLLEFKLLKLDLAYLVDRGY